MTTPADTAFLAAIIAAPADDLPRLIYADYLDERGRSERAEFIRVQCELGNPFDAAKRCRRAGAVKCITGWQQSAWCPECVKTDALRRREAELLDAHARDWWPPLDPDYPVGWFFHRGFVARVTCGWDYWRRHAAAIRAATPLERVTLTSTMTRVSIAARHARTDGCEQTLGVVQAVCRANHGADFPMEVIARDILAAEYSGLAFYQPLSSGRLDERSMPEEQSYVAPYLNPWR